MFDNDNIMGGIAMGGATMGISNLLSEWHADKAFDRQNQLADKQFNQNMALQRASLSNQVAGAKMAGLNPAMVGQSPGGAQSVSQGSGAKGENVEINPSELLAMAQVKNLEAETDKTNAEADKIRGVDTENTIADTAKKIAETAYTEAGTDKINNETQTIKNINEQYSDQNKFYKENGANIASEWKKSNWYLMGSDATKKLVDSIASGSIGLSVGTLKALTDTIEQSNKMSDSDKQNYLNSVMDVVYQTQFENDEVLDALAQLPRDQQKKIKAETAKLWKEVKEVASKTHLNYELADTEELKRVNMDAERHYTEAKTRESNAWSKHLGKQDKEIEAKLKQINAEFESFVTRDLGINRKEGDVGGWLLTMFENTIGALLAMIGLVRGGKAVSKTNDYKTEIHEPDTWMKNMQKGLDNLGTGGRRMDLAPSNSPGFPKPDNSK